MIPVITHIFAARRNANNVSVAKYAAERLGKPTILIRPPAVFVETWHVLCFCPRHRS